jgi:3-oxoacyl-[acyl-carrier-protein] synthase-3
MASILGFGYYVPERVLGNEELAHSLGCDANWILQASGIRERRIAAPEQTAVDLAVAAAKDCLAKPGIAASPGLVIVSSGSADRRFPGPAAQVAYSLGLAGVPAIDLPLASAGSLFGMALAAQLAPAYGQVLVIAAEKMAAPAMCEPLDKSVAILFGDGAGACLISQSSGAFEIVDSVIRSDGAYASDLRLEFTGPVQMNGRSVIMQASRKVPAAIEEVLRRNGVTANAVRIFLMHQANQNLMDRVAKAAGVPSDRFYSNIARYGNTSSASMLIAAAEWTSRAPAQPGDLLCFTAFGAGYHWGALLAKCEASAS